VAQEAGAGDRLGGAEGQVRGVEATEGPTEGRPAMGVPPSLEGDALLGLIRRRFSHRGGFRRDRDVPEEAIRFILEAARWAPSAGNAQPWEFIVIREPETRDRIAELFKAQLREKIEIERALRGTAAVGGSVAFRHAPVFIIVLGDPRLNICYPLRTREERSESHLYSSLANATLQLMLAATWLGLGTQYISDASSPYMSCMLKAMLGIPEELKVYHLVPVGYVDRVPGPNPRRPLEEQVHRERYDRSRFRSMEQLQEFARACSVQSESYRW
jgi:nitroreductase